MDHDEAHNIPPRAGQEDSRSTASSGTSVSTLNASTSASSAMEGSVYKVGIKLPPFWAEEPGVWFAQVEGQFTITGITADSTKFYHVIAQLDHQYAREVKDIITNPPAENKYAKLKSELIKRLSASQEKKTKQLLMHEELGDRKPSQFLRHLQTLAGPAIPDDFLRTLWASRLPNNIQTVIATQADASLETVADLADKVSEIAPTNNHVAATTSANLLTEMQMQIMELTKEIASLKSHTHRRGRSRDNDRSQDRNSRSRSRQRNPDYCFYHNRFGNRATRCTIPCKYPTPLTLSSSENASGSRK